MPTENPDLSQVELDCIFRAKREWEQTFDAVADMIIIVGLDDTILRANRAVAERSGLTVKELVGSKCRSVLHAGNSSPDYCPKAKLLEFGEHQVKELELEQLNGIFEISTSPIFDGNGHLAASVHIIRDITEKKKKEGLLATQQKQLESFNRELETRIAEAVDELRKRDDILIQQNRLSAMGELINSIAHHWRQPLNNIALIVQSLQLAFKSNDLTVEELDAEIAETMQILQQISDTVDDFRNFFSHENEPHSFSINDAVARSFNFVMPSLKNKGINTVLDERADIKVVGYPNEYAQALLNIFINARDALMEGQEGTQPLITVSVFEENGCSIVTVVDNGGGISEDILPKIFDPYFTTKGRRKNSGIGLYMSKMIIEENMNGSLSARNVAGGVEFRIEVQRQPTPYLP